MGPARAAAQTLDPKALRQDPLVVRRSGWAYPWGLRVRLCELLLRGIFDDGEPAQYAESHVQLVEQLQRQVWPLLAIKPDVADALLAWVHFRQVRL